MRFPSVLALLLSVVVRGVTSTSNDLTEDVTWDRYSLLVKGQRTFLFGAEFHYQRLPVPELWPDVLQKFKANGFNAISVYFFWSFHSPSPGVYDFDTDAKNVQRLFDYAKEARVWVVARAGPYCNAETSGGGLALWGSDGSLGKLRTANETYQRAWAPWIAKIGAIIAANQITEGGPVILNQIENEYQETSYSANATQVQYMIQLERAFRDAGVVVPSTHNKKGMSYKSWSVDYHDVGGSVDVRGLDSYPGGVSCTRPSAGFNVIRTYHQWFQNYSFSQPEYMPEFQGGWFSPWGDATFYDQCDSYHDPAFADVFYKNNIGQRVTLLNIYMAFGGTNWGHSAAPVVYTSYDYSAPLRETLEQTDKMFQTKLVALFTRVSTDLLKSDMLGNGTGFSVSSSSVYSWVLGNTDTGATFSLLQQNWTNSTDDVTFLLYLNTSAGAVTVPEVELYGRQSKIAVTDYRFGDHSLLYATPDILVYGVFEAADVVVFYLKEGQTGNFALEASGDLAFQVDGDSPVSTRDLSRNAFRYVQAAGTTLVSFSNGVLVYLLDQPSAWRFWAPATTSDRMVKPDQQIFVLGPYLVRDAYVTDGQLVINGDSKEEPTELKAYTGTAIDAIVWNGESFAVAETDYGSHKIASIPGPGSLPIELPALTDWRSADSLPEAQANYDNSRWTVCDKKATLCPLPPQTLPALFSSDYGFYAGIKIYRGYFDNTRNWTGLSIATSGGLGFGFNLVGGHGGNTSLTNLQTNMSLPAAAIKPTGNVVTVVVDYYGHDQTSSAYGLHNPRGILGAYLLPSGSKTETGFWLWKIQGNAGGAAANLDPMRGPMNEGGLLAEHLGWFLPGFDSETTGLPDRTSPTTAADGGLSAAGIRFYSTTFELDIPAGLDVPLGLELAAPAGTVARVQLWVNGYQYGKYVPHLGPQNRFPVPPGIVNNVGRNTLALSLWAQTQAGASLQTVRMFAYGRYRTGFDFRFGAGDGGGGGEGDGEGDGHGVSYLQPGWVDRSVYA